MTEDLRNGFKRLVRYARFLAIIPIICMLRRKQIGAGFAFLAGVFIALFVMLAQGLYQVEVLGTPFAEGGYYRIFMGDMAVLFSTLIFFSMLFCGKNRIHYAFGVLAFSGGLYLSLLCGSRTAWLFIPFIMISLLCLYRKRLNRKKWQLLIMSMVMGSLFISIVQPERLARGLDQVWVNFKGFTPESNNGSVGVRLVLWRNSLLIFRDSPIVGTGMGDFKHDSLILLEKGLSYKQEFVRGTTNAHNIYFQLLAEGGLVGLTLLVFVVFISPFKFLYGLWKDTSDKMLHFYALLGLISLLAFAWFGLTESWTNRNPLVNVYCMLLLVFMSSAANRADELLLEPADATHIFQ